MPSSRIASLQGEVQHVWLDNAEMIPPFDETGYLPAGIHVATLEEVVVRFGSPVSIRTNVEYQATREKLARAEAAYAASTRRPSNRSRIDELIRHSLRRLINLMKEEIAIYEAGGRTDGRSGIRSDVELQAAAAKLARLERQYEAVKHRPSLNVRVREMTLKSLRQLVNQLTEEISRYECDSTLGASGRTNASA